MKGKSKTKAQLLEELAGLRQRVAELEAAEVRENLYRAIVEDQTELITRFLLGGILIFVNEACCRYLGKKREELLGHRFMPLIFPEDRAEVEKNLAGLSLESPTVMHKHRVLKADGEVAWLQWTNRAIFDDQGRVLEFQAVGRDITECQQAEEALEESEAKYRELVQNANSIILRMDPQGQVTFFNEFAQCFFGYGEEEILGQNMVGTIVPRTEKTGRDLEVMILDIGKHPEHYTNNENENMKHNGEKVWIAWTNKAIVDDQGKVTEILCIGNDISPRKKMEEELRKTSNNLQAVINASPLPIISLDLEGRVTMWNPAAQRVFGWEAQEVLGWPLPIVPENQEEAFRQLWQRHMQGESFSRMELQRQRKDGSLIDVSLSTATLYDFQGRVTGVMVVLEDISEHRRAAEALRESEERFKLLFEYAPDAYFLHDLEGNFINGNKAAEQMVGYCREELIGRNFLTVALLEPHQIPLAAEFLAQANQGQFAGPAEFTLNRKDGEKVTAELKSIPVNIQGENLMLGIARDITARQEAEEAFKNLVVNSPIGIFIIQGREVKLVNPGLQRITGYREDELIGKDSSGCVVSGFKEMVEENTSRMLKGESDLPFEFPIITKSGEIKWVMETVASTQYKGHRATLAYLTDISERKRLEAQLLQAQKMEAVGRLAGGVAHDFNNLLMAIMGYGEIMLLDLHPDAPLFHYTQDIMKVAERAVGLTRQLLAFSRKQILHPRIINLNTVILDLEKMLRPMIGEDIDLALVLDSAPRAIKADPGQIEQVIMNLAVNARDAMPRGGKLTIETANVELNREYAGKYPGVPPGSYVMLAVKDHGDGIDAETLSHIFEPFFTTKEADKGTGLGLSTVYGIVKQSEGHIEVDSKLGEGTTFKIYLPQVEGAPEAAPARADLSTPLWGSETVLVVEDEDILLVVVSRFLRIYGYTVLEARHGGEALLICEGHQGPIHLLLADVVMPQMSGQELSDRLTSLHPEMKVLYMSGYSEDAVIHQGVLEAGAPFLQKPFKPETLAQKVREVLDPR